MATLDRAQPGADYGVIQRGHSHRLRPVSSRDLGNGQVVIHSQCVSEPEPGDPTRPSCSLEEQRTVEGNLVVRLRYRFQGLWIEPLDLIRLPIGLPIQECPVCQGNRAFEVCEGCGGAGVVERDGERLHPPELNVTR